MLFHHDPAHSDEDLERLLAIGCDLWQDAPTYRSWRYEGMEIVLEATRSFYGRDRRVARTVPCQTS